MNEERELQLLVRQVLFQMKDLSVKVDQLLARQGITPTPDISLLDNIDVFNLFHISRTTLYEWRRNDLIPYIKIRGKFYYYREAILKMLSENPQRSKKI